MAGYSLGIVALTDIDNVPKGVMLVAGETASVTVGPSVATDADGTRDLIARLFSP